MSVDFKKAVFVMSCAELAQLPPATQLEVTFAGRSNVGKSSLINSLTYKKDLAKTSNTPGRTQALNFFHIDEQFFLVDIPGYGYAKASKGQVKKWTRAMKGYLAGRPNLRRVFLLIDSRHGVKDVDEKMMELLDDAAVNYQIVLTKTDKVKGKDLEKAMESCLKAVSQHGAAHPEIIASSSEKNDGIEAIRKEITGLLGS